MKPSLEQVPAARPRAARPACPAGPGRSASRRRPGSPARAAPADEFGVGGGGGGDHDGVHAPGEDLVGAGRGAWTPVRSATSAARAASASVTTSGSDLGVAAEHAGVEGADTAGADESDAHGPKVAPGRQRCQDFVLTTELHDFPSTCPCGLRSPPCPSSPATWPRPIPLPSSSAWTAPARSRSTSSCRSSWKRPSSGDPHPRQPARQRDRAGGPARPVPPHRPPGHPVARRQGPAGAPPGRRHPGRAQPGQAPAGAEQPLRRPGGGRPAPRHHRAAQHRRAGHCRGRRRLSVSPRAATSSCVERLRYAHGEPMARLRNHLPAGLFDCDTERARGHRPLPDDAGRRDHPAQRPAVGRGAGRHGRGGRAARPRRRGRRC